VFSQPVPDNALVEDTTITDDTTLDKRVKETLRENSIGRGALKNSAREYHGSCDECSDAVDVLATVLLPAILEDNQASLVASYKDTIKHNPWLVRMPVDACTKETYGNIRRIGLCGS